MKFRKESSVYLEFHDLYLVGASWIEKSCSLLKIFTARSGFYTKLGWRRWTWPSGIFLFQCWPISELFQATIKQPEPADDDFGSGLCGVLFLCLLRSENVNRIWQHFFAPPSAKNGCEMKIGESESVSTLKFAKQCDHESSYFSDSRGSLCLS